MVIAVVGFAVVLLWARKLVFTPVDSYPSVREEDAQLNLRRFSARAFAALGAALLIATVIGQDTSAREGLHTVSLPTEVTDAGDVLVQRTINRNILNEHALFEIMITGEPGQFAGVTNQELLMRSPLDLRVTDEGATLVRIGLGTSEIWEITRNDLDSSITLRAWRTLPFPPLNTSIFVSAILFLAATSRRLRGLLAEEIPGRVQASWFAIGAAAVIGLRLVVSLLSLEADVGTRAERDGRSLFEVFTAGQETPPISLHEISGWFFPFNVAILLPLFGLALIGLRRLGVTKRTQVWSGVVAVIVSVIFAFRFGELIWDWFSWFLD